MRNGNEKSVNKILAQRHLGPTKMTGIELFPSSLRQGLQRWDSTVPSPVFDAIETQFT